MDSEEYKLIRYDNHHWYVIPADKEEAAKDYFSRIDRYYECSLKKEPQLNFPIAPAWLEYIVGPESLRFTGHTTV